MYGRRRRELERGKENEIRFWKKEIDFVEREKEKCNGEKLRKLILRERKIIWIKEKKTKRFWKIRVKNKRLGEISRRYIRQSF